MGMPVAGIRRRSDWPTAPAIKDVQIDWHPSPNFGPRRDGGTPRLIVLHYTAMDDCARARDWLCTPAAQVSAHYIVSERGAVTQMVDEAHRAWHAGAGGWQGIADVNSWSIGIELANTGSQPFSNPQMCRLEDLLSGIMARHGIAKPGVIAHSDCAPGRKIDPGSRFDWHRLARLGLAICARAPHPEAVESAEFERRLTQIGYPLAAPDIRLAAFRLRFARQNTGPLNPYDMAAAADILGQMENVT